MNNIVNTYLYVLTYVLYYLSEITVKVVQSRMYLHKKKCNHRFIRLPNYETKINLEKSML